jgi:hypothetical protein
VELVGFVKEQGKKAKHNVHFGSQRKEGKMGIMRLE